MGRYNVTFAKRGYMIFTSHLDMQRLFKRAFKRADIALKYSQGYNPHPLMSFAQPLSLGYYSECEILEFKTKEDFETGEITRRLNACMPEGLVVLGCAEMTDEEKTLASRCYGAVYKIEIPVGLLGAEGESAGESTVEERVKDYLAQDEIIAYKRSKKKKEPAPVNIKEKIQSIGCRVSDDKIIMTTKLDAGSDSNLSPELILQSFFAFLGLELKRETVDITRLELLCK